MGKADCLDQLAVQLQLPRDGPAYLGNFQRMREARPVEVAFVIDEYLGLVDEPPEGCRVHDSIAVTLKLAAIRVSRFGVEPAAARCLPCSVRREPGIGIGDRDHAAGLPEQRVSVHELLTEHFQ
jgi:hypothetical protein